VGGQATERNGSTGQSAYASSWLNAMIGGPSSRTARPSSRDRRQAAADISTGEFVPADLSVEQLQEELSRLSPAEVLVPREETNACARFIEELEPRPFQTLLDGWRSGRDRARQCLLQQFRLATLDAFEADELGPDLGAAGALLEYVREQKQSDLGHLRLPRRIQFEDALILGESTLRERPLFAAGSATPEAHA